MVQNKASRIRAFMAENPDAKPATIAKALKVHVAYVYNIKQEMKKQNPVTSVAPKAALESQPEESSAELIRRLRHALETAAVIIDFYENRLFGNSAK